MKRERLPFLTPLGLASAAAAVVAIAIAWWVTSGGLVTPGALRAVNDGTRHGRFTSHAQLGCGKCHVGFGGGTTSARCLACHDDTAAELAAKASLHGKLPDARACLDCHTEHRGPAAEITEIDRRSFPHQATAFALDAHKTRRDGGRFGCRDCHGGDVLHFPATRCSQCHADDPDDFLRGHVATYGDACQACHDGVDRFDDRHFDHAATEFPLDGGHVGVACDRCHRDARALAGFELAAHRCVDCHRDDDVHQGDNGQACERCHDSAGWKPARRPTGAAPSGEAPPPVTRHPVTPPPVEPPVVDPPVVTPPPVKPPVVTPPPRSQVAPDDHVFPLDHGRGGEVACATCHPVSNSRYTCYGCHHHTPSNVERIHAPRGIDDTHDCAGCHPTGGRAIRR